MGKLNAAVVLLLKTEVNCEHSKTLKKTGQIATNIA